MEQQRHLVKQKFQAFQEAERKRIALEEKKKNDR